MTARNKENKFFCSCKFSFLFLLLGLLTSVLQFLLLFGLSGSFWGPFGVAVWSGVVSGGTWCFLCAVMMDLLVFV